MTSAHDMSDDRPTIFCLHYLGGSKREWTLVARYLQSVRCVAIDLAGFGDAAQTPGYSVAEMAEAVTRTIRANAPQRWLLAGHSMGAKVAAVVARRAEDGADGIDGFSGLVLLAGSPPSPEPMDDAQRQTMLSWFDGDLDTSRAQAEQYVAQNSARDLVATLAGEAVNDVLRTNREAWVAWLDRGSREDWADRVGVIQATALVIAGSDDEALGPDAQHTLTAPHFAHVRCVTIAGAKHLLPLERPQEVARLIDDHWNAIDAQHRRATQTDERYRTLINSDRVGSATRRALLAREEPETSVYEPIAMSVQALNTLRAVMNRVVPQNGSVRIDMAARIDRQLGEGVGDGWRFAALPIDAEAYRCGLLTLSDAARRRHGSEFSHLDGARQDDLLTLMADGELGTPAAETTASGRLTAKQMRTWFEDVRADAVKIYMAHPRTLARIGYSGIANGGDGEPKSGFARVGVGQREAWEPVALSDATP